VGGGPQRLGAQFQLLRGGLRSAQTTLDESASDVEGRMSSVRLLRRISYHEGNSVFVGMFQSPFHVEPQPALQLPRRILGSLLQQDAEGFVQVSEALLHQSVEEFVLAREMQIDGSRGVSDGAREG